jgi:hypothetical protein
MMMLWASKWSGSARMAVGEVLTPWAKTKPTTERRVITTIEGERLVIRLPLL